MQTIQVARALGWRGECSGTSLQRPELPQLTGVAAVLAALNLPPLSRQGVAGKLEGGLGE